MKTEKGKMNIEELLAKIGRAPMLSEEKEMVLIKAIHEKVPEKESDKVLSEFDCEMEYEMMQMWRKQNSW